MPMLLPAALVASHLIQVSATVCPPNHTDVRVYEDVRPPRIDESKTVERLKAMNLSDILPGDLKFADTTGITTATIVVDSEIRTKSSGPQSGPVCISPSVISIKLSAAPTIYIDTSHGQCRRNVALEHETEHTAIDRALIDRYVPIFRSRVAAMDDAIGNVKTPSYDDLPKVRERIEDKINAMLSVTYDLMSAERAVLQQQHDSPEEYRRVSAACPAIEINQPATAPHPHAKSDHGS